jgi:hypothetical protein
VAKGKSGRRRAGVAAADKRLRRGLLPQGFGEGAARRVPSRRQTRRGPPPLAGPRLRAPRALPAGRRPGPQRKARPFAASTAPHPPPTDRPRWDVLLENLSDPSHLPFAHHAPNGLRRDKAAPLPFTPVRAAAPGEAARGELGFDGSRPPNVLRHAPPVALFRYPSISGSGALALVAVSAPCSVSYYSRNRAAEISTEVGAPDFY